MEKTFNDSYLVEKENKKKNDNEASIKIVYRKELLHFFKEKFPKQFAAFDEASIKKIENFRSFVDTAEKNGYRIYQLTLL